MNVRNFKISLLFIAFISLMTTSCYHRVSCDSGDNKNLGKTDFSEEFKQWSIENSTEDIVFSNGTKTIKLNKREETNKTAQRIKVKNICESIDIKPYTAYSYYEYDDISSSFLGEQIILSVEPSMTMVEKVRTEVIFLSFNLNGEGVKAQVPVINAEKVKVSEPYGRKFELKEAIEIAGKTFKNVWHIEREKNQIVYSKKDGILAIAQGDDVYLRQQ